MIPAALRNVLLTALPALTITAAPALADGHAPVEADGLEKAIKDGTLKLNVRARLGFADFDNGTDTAFAPTIRTRLGYETAPLGGFVGYLEFEDIQALDDETFNSTQNGNTDHAVIADVEATEVNQAWIAYTADNTGADGTGLWSAKLGRQVITLDDHRFIGHVGWRQDQQTYDALRFTTDAGVAGLTLTAGYIDQVNRIFGEEADVDSESFFVNGTYATAAGPKVTGFVYGLDFDNSPINSSLTVGGRLTGRHALSADHGALVYAASVATQTDFGDNPVSYDALFYSADLAWATPDVGTLGVGYEVLGSDDGNFGFRTPLATLHKFNGYADVFLVTPNAGLADFYAYYAFALPKESRATAKIITHFFQTDDGGGSLGWELDAVSSYRLSDHVTLGAKAAYFNGDGGGPFDRARFTLDLTYAF